MLPLIIQVEKIDSNTAHSCAFKKSPVRVGRNPLNDLVLEEGYISQWHGVIRFDGDVASYLDLGSTNPTLIDGQPVARNVAVTVSEGSDLRLGNLRLHLLRAEPPAELYGNRRKSAFAQLGGEELGTLGKTMWLPQDSPMKSGLDLASLIPKSSGRPPSGGAGSISASAEIMASERPPVQPATPVKAVQSGPKVPESKVSPNVAKDEPPRSFAAPVGLSGGYAHYRKSWAQLLAAVRMDLEAQPKEAREARLSVLQSDLPGISREPEFRKLMEDFGVNPLHSGQPELAEWFRRLTDGLFPPMGAPINAAIALERVGEILEVFSSGFLALRRAHESFAREMNLELGGDGGALHGVTDTHALLAYLLEPGAEGGAHITDLQRAFADLSLHEVGVVGAVVEGARGLLAELSPGDTDEPELATKGRGFFGLGRAKKSSAELYQRYTEKLEDLVDEDRFVRTLFGRKFARHYYAITGGKGS